MKRASTADILGSFSKSKVPARWAKHHRDLSDLRDQMLNISAPKIEVERTDDVADAGSSEIDQNLEMALHRGTRETLGEIVAALRRIETGTYGVCELTGEEIESDRLAATPWARYSLAGQAELERSGGNNHARIGERQSVMNAEAPQVEESEETESSVAA